MRSPDRNLVRLPKAHLHLHLEGSFPAEAVATLAEKRGRPFRPPERFDNVDQFFTAYRQIPELIETLDDLAELCRALVAAEARQRVVYAEPAVEPQLYSPRLGSMQQVLAVMCETFDEARRTTGVEVGALVTMNTDHGTEGAEELARLAACFAGKGVVAFGTAGFIEPAGLARFSAPVEIARSAGLRIVCHAGQTGGPDSVRDALDNLHPDRIAHGFRSAEDPSLLRRLADEGIVCDVCPSSNVALKLVPDLAHHPLPALLEAGVAVTLNADDELFFGHTVTDQYQLARAAFGVLDLTLGDIASNAAWGSGMSELSRQRLLRGVDSWLNG